MKVVICPNSFKGSLSAKEAAEAMARGVLRADPTAEIDLVPLADGGDGTLDTLMPVLGGSLHSVRVQDPLGREIEATFGLTEKGLAVVELAQASGLVRLAPHERDPTRTSTYGTGQLILAACQAGAQELLVTLGGSATHDGGTGMATALGYRFLDPQGDPLPPGGLALLNLSRIDGQNVSPFLKRLIVRVACDVKNPLTGPQGATVFAPQKGARGDQVELLDQALATFARVVQEDLGLEIDRLPGAGAAGGSGAGLVAFLGAKLESGTQLVLDLLDLKARIAVADLVITGEGAIDAQSWMGKLFSGIVEVAQGTPLLVLVGRIDPSFKDSSCKDPATKFEAVQSRFKAGQIWVDDLGALAKDEADAIENAAIYLEQLTHSWVKSRLPKDPLSPFKGAGSSFSSFADCGDW